MFRMRYIIIIVAIIVIYLIISSFISVGTWRKARRTAGKARRLFKEIDKKYEYFIKKRISLSIIHDNTITPDRDQIADEALRVLKPEIDGLLSLLSISKTLDSSYNIDSKYFKNAASLSDSLFAATKKRAALITPEEESRYYNAFYDAIIADISNRSLDLQCD